ncbi:GWxTD domain-containing protein [candidate division KSB1 bacterium]|nr:GWxTD domain-containing protein [candidate division KSB1 bacterium]
MRYIKLVVLLIVVTANIALAQDNEQKEMNFNYDYACFKSENGYLYLEWYVSIFTNHLQYIEDNNRFKAGFSVTVSFFDQDSLVMERSWRNANYVDSLEQLTGNQKLYSTNHFFLKPGSYKAKTTILDENSGRSKEYESTVDLTAFPIDTLIMSDIQFASSIRPDTLHNQYYKNGYQIIPNTDRFYGQGLPMLLFYVEIYNLKLADEADKLPYSITYSIYNSDDQLVRKFPARAKHKPGNSAVEVGGFNIITFPSGTYFLQLDVVDSTNSRTASQKSKFFVYRPGDFEGEPQPTQELSPELVADRSVRMLQGIYNNMEEAEIDNEFGAAGYIATKEEQSIYKTLDLIGKRQFMPQFWAKRDDSINTPQNEYRESYLTRMYTAEKEFRGFKKGWRSDEGRILLMYGIPDEIERFPSGNETRAYRIWHFFSIQGGVDFIFVDRRGWGEYELVHSNARGELYDNEWTRWLDPNK